jgi:hypothetical protein
MVNIKNKKLINIAEYAGIALMTTAAVLSSVVVPESQTAVTHDLSYNDHHRREKEEAESHYVSYNTSQRTPSRSANF